MFLFATVTDPIGVCLVGFSRPGNTVFTGLIEFSASPDTHLTVV
jgi:hypothetical protein